MTSAKRIDVEAELAVIADAAKSDKPEAALAAAIRLAGQVLRDVQRIADSLEEIAISKQGR